MVPNGETLKLAVIPARGGSKRIPRKNIKPFCGRPILAYSIEAAVASGLFDEVMVSTDDEEIAAIARQYGASVPFLRSAEASNDYAGTMDVLLEVLERYRQSDREFSYLCCIYPAAPFVTAEKLRQAFQMFRDSGADTLVPVIPFSYPPQRGFSIQGNRLRMKWPENLAVRSQDLEPIYHDCGQFYFGRTDALLREKKIFGQNTVPLFLSELEVQDIDNEDDWKLAELKYELMKENGSV